jgi:hypothetical protein
MTINNNKDNKSGFFSKNAGFFPKKVFGLRV